MRQFYLSKRFSVKEKMDIPTIKRAFEERLGKTFKILHLKENQDGKINIRIMPRARSVSMLRSADIKAECEFLLSGNDLRILCFGAIRLPREKFLLNTLLFLLAFALFWACEFFTNELGHINVFEIGALIALLVYFRLRTDKKKKDSQTLLSQFIDSFECEFKE